MLITFLVNLIITPHCNDDNRIIKKNNIYQSIYLKFLSLEFYSSIMYNFNESKNLENNNNNIVERFEKVKLEIDQSIKNFEVKIAEIISNNKLNDEQKHDIQKLGTIIKQVDDNLINLKDMLK